MKHFITIIAFIFAFSIYAQNDLSALLTEFNKESVSYISVDKLNEILKQTQNEKIILLDARENIEYEVSHIKNAIFVGYDKFSIDKTKKELLDKNAKIIVYCSLGIRSEDIAEKLQEAGYTNVFNLYGGIFEWKNNENQVFNNNEKVTEEVHTFSKEWSKWLKKGKKIYE